MPDNSKDEKKLEPVRRSSEDVKNIRNDEELDSLRSLTDAVSRLNQTIDELIDITSDAQNQQDRRHNESLNKQDEVASRSENSQSRQKDYFEDVIRQISGMRINTSQSEMYANKTFGGYGNETDSVVKMLASAATNPAQMMLPALNIISATLNGGLASTITQMLPVLTSVTGALTGLSSGILGLTAVMSTLSIQAISQGIQYQKDTLKFSPNSTNTGNLGNPYQDNSQFYRELRDNLTGGMDIRELVGAALKSNPVGGYSSGQELQSTAYTYGVLKDYGVDPSQSGRSASSMNKDLLMGVSSSNSGLLSLASTAKMHSIEISEYTSKVIEMTKSVRGFGYTVANVDQMFKNFKDSSYSNGQGITIDGAMQATRMAAGLQQSLSFGQAAYLATTEGSGLSAGNSSLAGGPMGSGGMSLGNLASLGPGGGYLAANLMRSGQVGGVAKAIQDQVNRIAGLQYNMMGGDDLPNEQLRQSAKGFVTADTLKKLGLAQGEYGKDEGFTALVDQFTTGKFGDLSAEAMDKKLKKYMPKNLTELKEDMVKDFKDIFTPQYTEVQAITTSMKSIDRIIDSIKDVILSFGVPIMEKLIIAVSGISTFLLNINKGLGPARALAEEDMTDLSKQFARFNKTFLSNSSSDVILNSNAIGSFGSSIGNTAFADAVGGGGGSGTPVLGQHVGSGGSRAWNKVLQAGISNSKVVGPNGLTTDKLDSLADAAKALGMPLDYLMAALQIESNYNPTALNKGSRAAGLIQMIPSTAAGYGVSTNQILNMSFQDQLKNLVVPYMKNHFKRGGSLSDLYASINFPAAVGLSENAVVYDRHGNSDTHAKGWGAKGFRSAYYGNQGLDVNHDGKVQKWEFSQRMMAETQKAQRILGGAGYKPTVIIESIVKVQSPTGKDLGTSKKTKQMNLSTGVVHG